MTYKVQITATAKKDAKDYATFISKVRHAPKAARDWLDGLFVEISSLAEHPCRFAVIAEADELNFPYRSFNYHSHRVVYAVHEAEKQIIVHRIWHGARTLSTVD